MALMNKCIWIMLILKSYETVDNTLVIVNADGEINLETKWKNLFGVLWENDYIYDYM